MKTVLKVPVEIIFPNIEVEIQPVGLNEPTRFDVVAKGVNGGFICHAKTRSQAEAWKDGVVRTIQHIKDQTTIKILNNEKV